MTLRAIGGPPPISRLDDPWRKPGPEWYWTIVFLSKERRWAFRWVADEQAAA